MTGLKTAFTRQPAQTTTTTLLQKTGLSHSNAVFADNLVGTLGSMGTVYWSRAGSSLITSSTRLEGAIGNGVRNINRNGLISTAEKIPTNQKAIVLGQETALSVREMFKLKEAGKLNNRLDQVYKNTFPSTAARESFELFQKTDKLLKPYRNKMMPEVQIKELIQSTGIKTYPRPTGIPKNFLVKITKDGAGIKYIDPINSHISIRVMPGKPHSELPFQQKPYVIHMKEGYAIDKFGNIVNKKSPEAHIPFENFSYKD